MGSAFGNLTENSTVVRDPGVLASEMDGALFLLHVDGGACVSLTGPSARLWALLAEPVSAAEAARQLVQEYVVDESDCRQQVLEHFRSLCTEGLISVSKPAE